MKGQFILIAGLLGSNGVFIFSEGANGTIEGVGQGKRKTRRCTFVGKVVLSRRGSRVFIGDTSGGGVFICSLRKGFGQDFRRTRNTRCLSIFSCSTSGLVYCSVSTSCGSKRGESGRFCRTLVSGRSKDIAQTVPLPFSVVGTPFIRGKSVITITSIHSVAPSRKG